MVSGEEPQSFDLISQHQILDTKFDQPFVLAPQIEDGAGAVQSL
jgi:hypothetical protein